MYKVLISAVERRFLSILAAALLILVAGSFLWYSKDTSERYFNEYNFSQWTRATPGSPVLQMPWWQFDLSPGDTLRIPLRLPRKTPDGRWFLEVLGHPIDEHSVGAISSGRSAGVFPDTRPPPLT